MIFSKSFKCRAYDNVSYNCFYQYINGIFFCLWFFLIFFSSVNVNLYNLECVWYYRSFCSCGLKKLSYKKYFWLRLV
jgi:hypothetical protein